MKKRIRLFLPLALLFEVWNPVLSVGGGVSSAVEVDRLDRHAFGSYTLVLRSSKADSGGPFGDCEVVTIDGGYSFLRWLFASLPDALSWKGHQAALEKLLAARQRQIPVRFGAMGAGLRKSSEGSGCIWESRGLAVLPETDEEDAVYSFYEWP
ncbi:MAG: hypothetical protein OEU68_18275 [Nitrospira sp.]|nr:hypothetical protein [Nitrospira sp.]MDH4244403.1 hypothetical protein [Nitrospira sp.]MDH4356825.1 hypothetical protein [Nitrospira sp.]MDH5318192.1 hypothetical protein [Nitrospira sp.]